MSLWRNRGPRVNKCQGPHGDKRRRCPLVTWPCCFRKMWKNIKFLAQGELSPWPPTERLCSWTSLGTLGTLVTCFQDISVQYRSTFVSYINDGTCPQCCCPWPWSLALACPQGQILSPWPWPWESSPWPWPWRSRPWPWPWAKVLGLDQPGPWPCKARVSGD